MKDTRREEGVRQTGETGRANAITEGVIWKQLLLFFFPILFGTFFQQLYNTADAVVVGRFVGKEALAAVGGSTSMLTNLLVGFFVGLSSGATVIIAQPPEKSRALHTLHHQHHTGNKKNRRPVDAALMYVACKRNNRYCWSMTISPVITHNHCRPNATLFMCRFVFSKIHKINLASSHCLTSK